jgi:hypothetical protein
MYMDNVFCTRGWGWGREREYVVQTMRTHKKLYFDCSRKYEMHPYPIDVFCCNSWDFLNFRRYENNKIQ